MKDDRLDDVAGGSHAQYLADVERRLSALKPTPAKLDAAVILHKARLPVERSVATQPQARSPGWLKLGASWTCGALAGALVTFVVLSRSVGPAEQQSALSASTIREDTPVVNTVDDHVAEPTKPLWSHSELLVATQLRQLTLPSSLEQTQLRAGSYASLTIRPNSDSTPVPAGSTNGPRSESTAESRSPSIDAPTPSSRLDRDRLLRELLGDVPNSVL